MHFKIGFVIIWKLMGSHIEQFLVFIFGLKWIKFVVNALTQRMIKK